MPGWRRPACSCCSGLLVTPRDMLDSAGPALGVVLALIFVARPVAVWICLLPFRFSARETWFISWVGLRGAVPIVLALFPLLAGTPHAALLFNIAFVVVLTSLLAQGSTIAWVARWLGVAMPDPSDEQQVRAVFRDFSLDPATTVGFGVRVLRTATARGRVLDARRLDARGTAPRAGRR